MSTQVFRINYKSDFVLNMQCDAGWAVPFTIKFWAKGLPTSHYFVSYDGTTYANCSVLDDPTVLRATFDDHHLGCGELMFQITYSMDVDDFRTHIEDDVMNVSSVTIEQDGQLVQVVLNFEGETAPEIAYAMPAFAAEAARVAAEAQRVLAEAQREENELARQQAETQRQAEFEAAQEERREAFDQSQEEQAAAFNSAQQSRAQSFNEQAADFESRYTVAEQRRDTSFDASQSARQTAYEESERQRTIEYQSAEAQRDSDYQTAEEQRTTSFDASQSARQTAYEESERQRTIEYQSAEAQRDSDYQTAEEQRTTSFDASQSARQTAYEAAEGTESGSVAGDGSRWGEFKQAEAQRDTILNDKMQFVDEFAQDIEDNYAKKDGAYEEMLAGSALNLVDTSGSPVLREFTFDTAGGSDDIGTGSALIKKMRGNTIVWNQKLNIPYVTYPKNTVTDTFYSNIFTTSRFLIKNHKYYIKVSGFDLSSVQNVNKVDIFLNNSSVGNYTQKQIDVLSSSKEASCIMDCEYDLSLIRINLLVIRQDTYTSYPFSFKGLNCIDLTQMFGAGNEPSTVEEFEKLFPMPYYDYNEGQLLSFNGNSIKTVGFNQWDEEWEVGQYSPSTGEPVSHTTAIRSKNYTPIFPNTTYYIRVSSPTIPHRILFYDSQYNYIGTTELQLFTAPNDAHYLKFHTSPLYGNVYHHDICINLSWSGTKNGTYEPYQEHVHDISFYKTIKDGDGNLLFPNGLLSAGSAYDEVTATKAIKRVGVVDLGILNWVNRANAEGVFQTDSFNYAYSETPNIICERYPNGRTVASGDLVSSLPDKQMYIYQAAGVSSKMLYIHDTSYTDAATFKAAMQGVMLYYELAEPIEVDFEEQNMAYQVNDWGTEQLLPENTSTPTTTPAMLDVTYGINAVDTIKNLPRNYLAQDDLDRLLSAMGSALGFTYTKTWNATDKQWSFTVTKTATTNDENV